MPPFQPTAVNITDINVYDAWGDSNYGLAVLVEVDTGSGYSTLIDGGDSGGYNGEVRYEVTDDTNPGVTFIATGVVGLRLSFDANSRRQMIREIDVEGAVVPEPGTTALLGLGGLALILRRRK